MAIAIEPLAHRLRTTRLAKGIRQTELSKLTGVPQAQISRIEANAVDLRVSSLVSLAHALDMEVVLAPRKALPAIESFIRQSTGSSGFELNEPKPAYTLEGSDG